MSTQPEALRLAESIDPRGPRIVGWRDQLEASAELRRLHEENESLKAWRQDALKFIRMAEDFARAAIAKAKVSNSE